MANCKRQFVPRDQGLPLLVVCCALFVPKNKNFLCELKSSPYTDVVIFFFTFFVLFENMGEHARKKNKERLFSSFPHPYLLALVVNRSPGVFVFYHARSTDFEEKIEGL